MRFLASARISAASSTIGPRAVLIRNAVGFISANSRSLIMWRVSSLSGGCNETKSERASNSSNGT